MKLRRSLPAKQSGVAILIFVTLIVLTFSTLLINQLSVNQRANNQTEASLGSLNLAKQSLVGYGLSHTIPGTLPCPDTTGDGLENPQGANCQSALGLFPHRTLNSPLLVDGSGARLWYAVDLNHTANAASLKNSSIATSLTLNGISSAALVIGPGAAVDVQSRRLLNQSDHLEGLNANADFTTFESIHSLTQNDLILPLQSGPYWTQIERLVLSTTDSLVGTYRAACGEYPWAATFGGPFDSTTNLQIGSPPFATALPDAWGAICASGTAPVPPAWLTNNWSDQLLYRMCLSGEGNCVSIVSDNPTTAAGIILAPGVSLGVQVRPDTNTNDYFEAENINLPDSLFRLTTLLEHDTTYNDSSRALNP